MFLERFKTASSKMKDIFDFTTLFTTIARKDMPAYAVRCHQNKDAGCLECFGFQIKHGISWYKIA